MATNFARLCFTETMWLGREQIQIVTPFADFEKNSVCEQDSKA